MILNTCNNFKDEYLSGSFIVPLVDGVDLSEKTVFKSTDLIFLYNDALHSNIYIYHYYYCYLFSTSVLVIIFLHFPENLYPLESSEIMFYRWFYMIHNFTP